MEHAYIFFHKHTLICIAFILTIFIILTIEIVELIISKDKINIQNAINILNHKNGIIVDFRNEEKFKQHHIINSININNIEEKKNIEKLNKLKKNYIIVIHETNLKAYKIIKKLKKQEFKNFSYIYNGLNEWKKEEYPIVVNNSTKNES